MSETVVSGRWQWRLSVLVVVLHLQSLLSLEILGVAGSLLETKVSNESNVAEQWGDWKELTACSRSCGGGVKLMERRCSTVDARPDGQSFCTGPGRTHISCNLQECPSGSKDFRTTQCEHYNYIPFNGSFYEWEPYYHANKCSLYCQAKGQSFYYRHAEKVLDGTPCEIQSQGICVTGICVPVGCDKKLGSDKRFDNCMVCDGNNSTCRAIIGSTETQSMKSGYNELIRIPEGATSITIEEENDSRNFLAAKNQQGVYFLNGEFTIDVSQTKVVAGSAFEYRRTRSGKEFLFSRGPLTETLLVEILKQPGGSSPVKFQFFLPLSEVTTSTGDVNSVESERTDANETLGLDSPASWSVGDWGQCSSSCGSGIRTGAVKCQIERNGVMTIVNDSLCDRPKPSAFDRCESKGLCDPVEWIASEWSGCHNQCEASVEYREVICSSRSGRRYLAEMCDSRRKPESERSCPLVASCQFPAQWHSSQWTSCSLGCGKGIQKRKVFCAQLEGNILRIVPSSRCIQDDKMTEERTCSGECSALWYTGPFGNCSMPCDGGQRQRLVLCFERDEVVNSSRCDQQSHPFEREDCNQHPCTDDELLSSGRCRSTEHGCCPDGLTSAEGPDFKGCSTYSDLDPAGTCEETTFGCCTDRITAALSFDHKGCPGQRGHEEPVVQEAGSGCDPNFGFACEIRIAETRLPGPLIDCRQSEFGCCADGLTVALGENGFGCQSSPNACVNQLHGCCPDGLTPALGPDMEGCFQLSTLGIQTRNENVNCVNSAYGCCGDGITSALGSGFDGCPEAKTLKAPTLCNQSSFGCCPDGVTPADGPDHEGCHHHHHHLPTEETPSCNGSVFGCCSDGISRAQGPHQEGCPGNLLDLIVECDLYVFGCCLDGKSMASGPNFEGCNSQEEYTVSCFDSAYGCCPDGVMSASGLHYIGCPTRMANGGICSLARDSKFCSNYTVKWYFDSAVGDCNRFWFGGCDGDSNKFDTEEHCQSSCIRPEGLDRCFLPASGGRCRAQHVNYFYDPASRQCERFSYGGCGGNNNRFDSVEQCEHMCADPLKPDVCSQPYSTGPCRGQFERWYYDKDSGLCRPFIYGGCKGNENRFETLEACQQRCREPVSNICKLDSDAGPCNKKSSLWFFNSVSNQCESFTYGGCQGNANRFLSNDECRNTCERPLKQKSIDICSLPAETGLCRGYFERWYHDPVDGFCKQFVYGGCGGNANRFESRLDCGNACKAKMPVDVCQLSKAEGSCQNFSSSYYFDKESHRCQQFYYGGCEGNGNNFPTLAECEKKCQRSTVVVEATVLPVRVVSPTLSVTDTDICLLSVERGPCRKSLGRWYYDSVHERCIHFAYGGCEGNPNRFLTQEECMNLCGYRNGPPQPATEPDHRHSEAVVTKPPYYTPPSTAPRVLDLLDQDVCTVSKDPGTCNDYAAVWYFESISQSCRRFLYSGCGGNRNRFPSQAECESECLHASYHDSKHVEPYDSKHVEPHASDHVSRSQFDPAEELRVSNAPAGQVEITDESISVVTPGVLDSQTIEVVAGRSIVLPYGGSPPMANAVWYKDGQIIIQDNREQLDARYRLQPDGSLEISDVRTSDAGKYAYYNGLHTVPISLEVYVSAAIRNTSTDEVLGRVNSSTEMNCDFVGIPTPEVAWLMDGYRLSPSQGNRIGLSSVELGIDTLTESNLKRTTLRIANLQSTDSGVYTCEVYNSISGLFYSSDRKQFVLKAIGTLTLKVEKEQKSYHVGEELRLTCETTGTDDVGMKISWSKDGETLDLENLEKYRQPSSDVLILDRVILDDAGEYRCKGGIRNVTETSSPVSISIQTVPLSKDCEDKPWYANCPLIIEANLCRHPYFSVFCCKSCHEAGYLP